MSEKQPELKFRYSHWSKELIIASVYLPNGENYHFEAKTHQEALAGLAKFWIERDPPKTEPLEAGNE